MEGLTLDAPTSTCKGQVFRGYSSTFYHKGRIERRQGMRLVKRLSCPGCDKCGGVDDAISESICTDHLILPDYIEHGGLYTVAFTNISTDWETGYVDSYDLAIVPLED